MRSELEVNSCPQSVDNLWITVVNSWINAKYWLLLSKLLVVPQSYPQVTHKQEGENPLLSLGVLPTFHKNPAGYY